MDEKVKSIQERLRASLSQKFSLDQGPLGMPVVTFEQVSTAPTGAEELVANVVRELKSRGYRVAHIKRYSENMVPATLCEFQAESVGADISLTAVPGYVITERPVEGDASIESMVDAVRDACDVVVGESFGYAPVPKILITGKAPGELQPGIARRCCLRFGKGCSRAHAAVLGSGSFAYRRQDRSRNHQALWQRCCSRGGDGTDRLALPRHGEGTCFVPGLFGSCSAKEV